MLFGKSELVAYSTNKRDSVAHRASP